MRNNCDIRSECMCKAVVLFPFSIFSWDISPVFLLLTLSCAPSKRIVTTLLQNNSGILCTQTFQTRRTLYIKCSCTLTLRLHGAVRRHRGQVCFFHESNKISRHDVLSTSLVLKPSRGWYSRTRPYLSGKVRLVASQPRMWGNFTSLLAEVQFKGKKIAHVMAHPFLFHSLSSPSLFFL
jgi:hypothetical protein